MTITAARAFEVIEMNRNGEQPDKLQGEATGARPMSAFGDILGQDAINRFDKKKKKKKKKPQPEPVAKPRKAIGRPDEGQPQTDRRPRGNQRGGQQRQNEPKANNGSDKGNDVPQS